MDIPGKGRELTPDQLAANMEEDALAHRDHPTLLDKLRQAKAQYAPDGETPSPELYDHATSLIEKIELIRKTERRADELRKQKRKAQTAARRANRRRR